MGYSWAFKEDIAILNNGMGDTSLIYKVKRLEKEGREELLTVPLFEAFEFSVDDKAIADKQFFSAAKKHGFDNFMLWAECLNCQKQFLKKTEKRMYCHNNCKLKHHRKNK